MTSKLASLHAGLVARKGEAAPAVSHTAFSYTDSRREVALEAVARPERDEGNDRARAAVERPLRTEETPAGPYRAAPRAPAQSQVRTLERTASVAEPRSEVERGKEHGPYRLTFRMTPDQRRRLRIAAAQNEQSLQQLLSEALDNHLDGLCACSLSTCTCLSREDGRRG